MIPLLKINVELDIKEAQNLIRQMPMEEKIKLVRELSKETWAKRMAKVFKSIDQRRQKHKISAKEIAQEIEKTRQEFYDRRRRH